MFGFLSTRDDLKGLLRNVVHILNGRTDVPSDTIEARGHVRKFAAFASDTDRYGINNKSVHVIERPPPIILSVKLLTQICKLHPQITAGVRDKVLNRLYSVNRSRYLSAFSTFESDANVQGLLPEREFKGD